MTSANLVSVRCLGLQLEGNGYLWPTVVVRTLPRRLQGPRYFPPQSLFTFGRKMDGTAR